MIKPTDCSLSISTLTRFCLSVFLHSILLIVCQHNEVVVPPSYWLVVHPSDIRIYYLVWHLHLLHCRDIVKSFNATSENVFRSIGRSFRSVFYVFSSLMQVSIRSGLLFSLTVGMLQPLSRIQQASAKLRNVFVKALLWC